MILKIDRVGSKLGKEAKIIEDQAKRTTRSSVDHVYTLDKNVQGRTDTGLATNCFFLVMQKIYDTVWIKGL